MKNLAFNDMINHSDNDVDVIAKTLDKTDAAPCIKTYTVYLLRHGEALHNVLEQEERDKVRREAKTQNWSPAELEERLEKARRSVLDDITLLDSPLTDAGKQQAVEARKKIQELHEKRGLPFPTQVFVSPLQRALQSADRVFPAPTTSFQNDACNTSTSSKTTTPHIHVTSLLQERMTGKPCDKRSLRADHMAKRSSFARFRIDHLRQEDDAVFVLDGAVVHDEKQQQQQRPPLPLDEVKENAIVDSNSSLSTKHDEPLRRQTGEMLASSTGTGLRVEGKEMLRLRTKKVFRLLAESSHTVIGMVSHKGFLRELERGYLGQPTASEFDNCEVRVYRISIDLQGSDGHLPVEVERLYPTVSSSS